MAVVRGVRRAKDGACWIGCGGGGTCRGPIMSGEDGEWAPKLAMAGSKGGHMVVVPAGSPTWSRRSWRAPVAAMVAVWIWDGGRERCWMDDPRQIDLRRWSVPGGVASDDARNGRRLRELIDCGGLKTRARAQ